MIAVDAPVCHSRRESAFEGDLAIAGSSGMSSSHVRLADSISAIFCCAGPVFEFLLTGNGVVDVFVGLEIDEPGDLVASGKGTRSLLAMF
jgi:hypothetical protein